MKPELKIEHLAGYLPYGLKMGVHQEAGKSWDLFGAWMGLNGNPIFKMRVKESHGWISHEIEVRKNKEFDFKPLLRPLSQLPQEIEHNGERFVPMERLKKACQCEAERDFLKILEQEPDKVEFAHLSLAKYLFEWHFDLHDLLSQNLAIEKL